MDEGLLKIVQEISERLAAKSFRLSVAESCTGGLIAHFITNLPGSSAFFDTSVVSYSAQSKAGVLGVRPSVLNKFGTVSEETSLAMAEAVRKMTDTEVSLAVTGVAGPESVDDKEVGLVFLAVSVGDRTESRGLKFGGAREEIKEQAAREALNYLNQVLRIWL